MIRYASKARLFRLRLLTVGRGGVSLVCARMGDSLAQRFGGVGVAFFGLCFLVIPARMERTAWRLCRTKHVYDGIAVCFCITRQSHVTSLITRDLLKYVREYITREGAEKEIVRDSARSGGLSGLYYTTKERRCPGFVYSQTFV